MKQISTNDQLLQLAYGELSSQEAVHLKTLLAIDTDLSQEWQNMKRMSNDLNQLSYSPSATSLRIVLEHSHEQLQEII